MLYMVNPGGRSRRRARGADGRFLSRKKKGRRTMARKAKGRKRTSTARKRKSTRRHRRPAAVTLRRRGRTVYASNPRRKARRRRSSYHRNPRIISQVKTLAMDTVMVGVGGAAQRVAQKYLPAMANPLLDAAKGTVVAIAVGMVGRKFLGAERARFLAAGAMLPVLKNAVTAYVPGAADFLGDYEPMGTYSPAVSMGDPYPDGGYLAGGVAPGSDLDTQDAYLGTYSH